MLSKHFISAVTILLAYAFVSIQSETVTLDGCINSCAGKRGYFISCQSCSDFFFCHWGHEQVRHCAAGLYFQPLYNVCIPKASVQCEVTELITGPPIDGGLSDYGEWSKCSTTCGGGVTTRERLCNDPAPLNGGKDCEGDRTQSKRCNEFMCPDCSRVCPNGGELVECAQCRCPGAKLEGRVLFNQNPLTEVTVYDVFKEWQPLVVTGTDGKYEINDICLQNLQLKFKKKSFFSQLDQYRAAYSNPLVMNLYKSEPPVFTVEPSDTAAFVGQTVTFNCEVETLVDTIEWYKEDVVVKVDNVASSASSYIIQSVTMEDAGRYACRSVSSQGNKFTNYVSLVVSPAPGGSRRRRDLSEVDSCESKPLVNTNLFNMPAGCYALVNGVKTSTIDLGVCSRKVCQFTDGHATPNYHCDVVSTRMQEVTCPGPNQEDQIMSIPVAKSCGCVLTKATNIIGIKGVVETVDGSPVPDVDIVVSGAHYKLHRDNRLHVETSSVNGRVLLHLFPSETHMPRVVSVDVSQAGVSETYVVIKLTPRPQAKTLQVATGGEVEIQSQDGTKALSIIFPANAMIDTNGNPISGEIEVYVTFGDAKDNGGLDTAPGQFAQTDENGKIALLNPYGVISIFLQQNGAGVYVQGFIKFKVMTDNLGIPRPKGDQLESPAALYSFNKNHGMWVPANKLTYPAPAGGAQVDLSVAETQAEFPSEYPVVASINELLPRRRVCQVSVQLYSDHQFHQPLAGELISVTTYTPGKVVGFSTAVTDVTGRACVSMPCNNEHELSVSRSLGDAVVVSPQHYLPEGYTAFQNNASSVVFHSDKLEDYKDLDGPVYPFSTGACRAKPKYGFKLALISPRPSTLGQLLPVNPLAGADDSWYRRNADDVDRKTCMLRLDILTNSPYNTAIVAQSFLGERYLGLFGARLFQAVDPQSFVKIDGNYRSCVEIRCPEEGEDTIVKLKLATTSKCVFRATPLKDNVEVLGVQDNHMAFLVKKSHFSSNTRGFYSASGKDDAGYRYAIKTCSSEAYYSAMFDCEDSSIKHMGWG